MSLEVQVGCLAAHEFSQFVVNDFHHQLLWLDGCEDVLPHGFLLDGIGERLCHLVVDVGIEQGATHVLQRFGNVYLGYLAFAFQYLERPLEPFA